MPATLGIAMTTPSSLTATPAIRPECSGNRACMNRPPGGPRTVNLSAKIDF